MTSATTASRLAYDPRRADTVVELVIHFFDRTRSWRDWIAFLRGPSGQEASAFEHLVLALLTDDLASARTIYRETVRARPEVRSYVQRRLPRSPHCD